MSKRDYIPYSKWECVPIVEVWDQSCPLPFGHGCFFLTDDIYGQGTVDVRQAHVDQGFARSQYYLSIGTILNWGRADVTVVKLDREQWPVWFGSFTRLIAIPLDLPSGRLRIDSADSVMDRTCTVKPGHYRVVVGQRVSYAEEERIEVAIGLEFHETPLPGSRILIADEELAPPETLDENAELYQR